MPPDFRNPNGRAKSKYYSASLPIAVAKTTGRMEMIDPIRKSANVAAG
jgi:hypothetical protein